MRAATDSVDSTDEKNAKSARLRKRRGYRWEESLVKRLNGVNGWRAFRLGSSSVALPDVLAVNTQNRSLLVIEAKSGAKTSLSVPPKQILRCLDWCRTFDIYDTRTVVLAFKFLSKKRLDSDTYETRTMREYYLVWDPNVEPVECVCTYDGRTYALKDGTRQHLDLARYTMPAG